MAGEGDEGVAVIISQAHESQRRREAIMNTVSLLIALHRRSNNDNLHVQLEIMIHELLEIALLFYTDAPADDDHDEDDDGPDSIPIPAASTQESQEIRQTQFTATATSRFQTSFHLSLYIRFCFSSLELFGLVGCCEHCGAWSVR